MTSNPPSPYLKSGMTNKQVLLMICVICLSLFLVSLISWSLFFACPSNYYRRFTIIDIRNCQQAMRGHQSMHGLKPGDPFTRKDLEEYMQFPVPPLPEDKVTYEAGDQVTPESADPAINSNHLWLRVNGKCTKDNLGALGFEDISDTTGW